jgi:hypothetical protein
LSGSSFNVIVLADIPARNPGDWCFISRNGICFPHQKPEKTRRECQDGEDMRKAAEAAGIPDPVILTKAEELAERVRVKTEIEARKKAAGG